MRAAVDDLFRQAFVHDAADAEALAGAGPDSKIDLNGCSG
jgi:hypothetical protein